MSWQPISSAPKDGTYIDLWVSGPRNPGARIPDCWFAHGRWLHDFGRDGDLSPELMVGDEPTHWMLPPEPPGQTAPTKAS